MDVPPLMLTTPGVTSMEFTAEPLGTEAELTSGPNTANPFRSAEEREIVEAYKAKEREQQASDVDLMAEEGVSLPFDNTVEDPTAGNDPFVFDDVSEGVMDLRLPFAQSDGPQF
jgi:hypothetical protein